MALDPYQLCPCGGGNKIKFCCSKDIVHELEKVLRAIEGEQRVAALDQLNRLIEEKGARDALLALKAEVLMALENFDAARSTTAELMKRAPHNPTALGLSSLMAASGGEVTLAVEQLQEALEAIDQMLPSAVYTAIAAVAQALVVSGDVLAARGHLSMQAGFAGDRDSSPFEMLMRIHMAREVPLLLKEDLFYEPAPEGAPWKGEFEAAMKSARRGAWLAACESLHSLDEKAPHQHAILKNIAILRTWLGQSQLAAQAWRGVAQLTELPVDDRVQAEMFAQILDPDNVDPEIDEVTQTYVLKDIDQTMEALLSEPRATQMPIDPAEFEEESGPPPRAAFWLLDRPTVTDVEQIERDAIPRVLGEMYVFGKQTDREARLEFVTTKTDDFVSKTEALRGVLGTHASEQPQSQEKTGAVSAVAEALSWRWRLPDNVSHERQQELLREQQREILLERWPNLPLAVLGQKTPTEAAADPELQVPLLAAMQLMEMNSEVTQRPFDFSEVRQKLNLPEAGPIDPTSVNLSRVSLLQISRLEVEKLSDEDLLLIFRRVASKRYGKGAHVVGKEIIRRDLRGDVPIEDVYEVLVSTSSSTDEALGLVAEAKAYGEREGQSPARWLLTELSIRLPRMEADACNDLIRRLQAQHMNEPGIADGLFRLLVSYGVITPDGQPAQAASMPSPGGQPQAASAASAAGKLWTPDGGATEGQSEQKSKLWVPGMD